MANIKDVARMAGVSVSSVSRALSGSANVNESAKERIMMAVQELNYVPDHIGRSLRNGRTRTISLLIPTILNPFFTKLVDCFSAEIANHGYATFLNISNFSKEEERRCLLSSKAFSVDGLLYVPGTDDGCHISEMVSSGIPTVIVNRAPDVHTVCVTNNDFLGGYCALKNLLDNGHRRVCCFVGNTALQNMRERYEGCLKVLNEFGIDQSETVFCYENDSNQIFQRVKELITSGCQITAFYASGDWMTKAIYSAIQSSGLSIPNDISVVGFDDISDSQYMFPPLTTWRHPINDIARKAVSMLVDEIENGSTFEDQRIVISGEMVIRESVKSINRV